MGKVAVSFCMALQVGDRVRMKRTDNVGTVSAVLNHDLYQVRLDGGLGEIPIPGEILEAYVINQPTASDQPSTFVNRQSPIVDPPVSSPATPPQKTSKISLAFDPLLDPQANPEAYQLYLLNTSPHEIIYDLKVFTGERKRHGKFGKIAPRDKAKIEPPLPYPWLNERLSIKLDVRAITPEGTGPRHYQQLKIKPKQFFTSFQDVTELYRHAHRYDVFPELDGRAVTAADREDGPSLKAITREHLASRPRPSSHRRIEVLSLQERAEFEEEIDLHLPALVKNPASVPKQQVLTTQLKFFEEYLERAVRLGVDHVFIIHGVGSGKLKHEIHRRLRDHRYVIDYKNEYHHKYGYGATEVTFG